MTALEPNCVVKKTKKKHTCIISLAGQFSCHQQDISNKQGRNAIDLLVD